MAACLDSSFELSKRLTPILKMREKVLWVKIKSYELVPRVDQAVISMNSFTSDICWAMLYVANACSLILAHTRLEILFIFLTIVLNRPAALGEVQKR